MEEYVSRHGRSTGLAWIEASSESQEFITFARQLARAGRSARLRHAAPILPTPLLVTGSGMGNTTVLRMLTELLKEEKMLVFSGEEEMFEWRLAPEEDGAVDGLLDRMEEAAGFYPVFSGVIGLDMTAAEKFDATDVRLLSLIRENCGHILFVPMVSRDISPQQVKRLEEQLAEHVQVCTVHLSLDRDAARSFLREEFHRQGFLLSAEAEELLEQVAAIPEKTDYRGLQLAVTEIIWRKAMEKEQKMITGPEIQAWLEERVRDSGKSGSTTGKRMIGFGSQEWRPARGEAAGR